MSKALEQIDAILDHIEQPNPQAARTVGAHIKHSIDLLATFPRSGRSSEIADIRELPIVRYPYVVFYTVNDAALEVNILRVRHTSQVPAHPLE